MNTKVRERVISLRTAISTAEGNSRETLQDELDEINKSLPVFTVTRSLVRMLNMLEIHALDETDALTEAEDADWPDPMYEGEMYRGKFQDHEIEYAVLDEGGSVEAAGA
jgi:hypothetical protein